MEPVQPQNARDPGSSSQGKLTDKAPSAASTALAIAAARRGAVRLGLSGPARFEKRGPSQGCGLRLDEDDDDRGSKLNLFLAIFGGGLIHRIKFLPLQLTRCTNHPLPGGARPDECGVG